MKGNKLDSFERLISDSLSGEEVAYNPSDWNDLSSRLNNVPAKSFYKSGWFLGGAASIILGASVFVYQSNKENTSAKEIKIETNEIIASKEIFSPDKSTVENNPATVANEENEIIKNNINTSSETKSKEEVAEVVTTNHQPPIETSSTSSITTHKEEKHKQKKTDYDVKVVIPTADYKIIGNTSGCKGLTVDFYTQEQENVNYLWNFGDGTYSSLVAPSHTYNKSGEFKVELIVQSTIDKGILTKSKEEETIVIHNDPHLEIIADEYLDKGCPMVHYSYLGDEVSKVFWNLGNGTSSNEKSVTSAYKKRDNYKVVLEATSAEGCKSITNKNIFIQKDYNLLAPSAFTPDGDGLNDVFIPEALKLMNNQFTMIIQGRREGVVFESTSLDQPWDGKNQKTGLECAEENYIWIVNLVNDKGEKEQYTGAVLIQR